MLADFQVTIPELGAIKAAEPPVVVITSNRTREIHDAIKRRCLYHWVDYPDAERELAIVRRKVPGADARLSREVVAFTQRLRAMDLFKSPGIAETLDWAEALVALDRVTLDPADGGQYAGRAAQIPGRYRRDHAGGRRAAGRGGTRRKSVGIGRGTIRHRRDSCCLRPRSRLAEQHPAFRAGAARRRPADRPGEGRSLRSMRSKRWASATATIFARRSQRC